MSNDTITCPRCNDEYHRFLDDPSFRSGRFVEEVGGVLKQYDTLCNRCYRELIRS